MDHMDYSYKQCILNKRKDNTDIILPRIGPFMAFDPHMPMPYSHIPMDSYGAPLSKREFLEQQERMRRA